MHSKPHRLDGWTLVALTVALVVRPAAYSAAPLGRLIVPIIVEHNRTNWWLLHAVILACQWVPFAFIWLALRKNHERWDSIGVDWGWFRRHWIWFTGLILVLVVAAFAMPKIHYDGQLPGVSRTIFLAPVSTAERLFMIFVALSAGVGEETQFRGFPFTRLSRVIGNPWLILPITVVSFLFIHGEPRNTEQLVNYTLAGLAFGVPFILMKFRRLEVLILIHFLIDAGMVLAP